MGSTINYNIDIIKKFTIACVFWGVLAFFMGDLIAWHLVFPGLSFDSEFLTFGRIRPVHTTLAIFAFGGCGLFAVSLYCVQKTSGVALFGGKKVAEFIFWGYQLFIIVSVLTYVQGFTQSKEYAEPEWYVDLWLAIVWVTYIVVFIGTLVRRQEKHIYVANWFFIGFMLTTAVLHIGNNIAIPVIGDLKFSYPVLSGAQSAIVQWWYGHNAVGFFLTAGFLGIMYYILPKQINAPIYSYRLSIVHFWALTFLYIWAGAHHLHYTSLPQWTQTLGMVMSIILWVPSWGGMVNGVMTFNNKWSLIKTDPVSRFLLTSIVFYGMSTFEGPLMAIKQVNSLSHYTDWTVGHVHSGALGWNALITFGAIYYLVPVLYNKQKMYSVKLIFIHYWFAIIGLLLYITAMWSSGITQGLMWKATDEYGFIKYSFIETLVQIKPYYAMRAIGGAIFLAGAIIMAYNIYKTIKTDNTENK